MYDVLPGRLLRFRDERQRFNVGHRCAACDNVRFDWAYTEESRIRDGDGHLTLLTTALGMLPDPHLVLTCLRCGFDFEMEVYNSVDRTD